MTDHYVIGIDAGGTNSTAWLARRDGHLHDPPFATGHGGPGNMRSVGFDVATVNLHTAIQQAIEACSGVIDGLCICAAGAGRPEEQDKLQRWAELQQIASRVLIATDVEAVLAAASDNSVGVALIAGTGSLAWGRNLSGDVHRTGGWGHLLGDEGSAYDIAMSGLRHAVRMADGRQPETRLLQTLLTQLKVQHPTELIAVVYSTNITKEKIASLAEPVFACAAADDPVSRQIIDIAADELALMVTTTAERLNLPDHFPLAMTGGVLIHQPEFRERLLRRLNRSVDDATIVESPARGAVAMARSMLNSQ